MTPMLFLCQKYHKREAHVHHIQPASWGLQLSLVRAIMMMSLPSALRLKCCSCYFIKKLPVSALCGFLSNGCARFREFSYAIQMRASLVWRVIFCPLSLTVWLLSVLASWKTFLSQWIGPKLRAQNDFRAFFGYCNKNWPACGISLTTHFSA